MAGIWRDRLRMRVQHPDSGVMVEVLMSERSVELSVRRLSDDKIG
jgi:hypothetical protein